MTTQTNYLSKVTQQSDLSPSDLLRLFSEKFGGEVALSLAMLTEYLQGKIQTSTLTAQYEAPSATGFSVTVSSANTWLVLTPDAAYAAGTIVLPAGVQDQEILVNCTQDVTALTVSGQGDDTVVGAPTTITANQFFRVKYDSILHRWYRVG